MGTLANLFLFYMRTKIIKFSSLIVVAIFAAVAWILAFSSTSAVYAATDETTVLRELQSDPDFDPAAYPDNPEDYSLQVIQLAEDKDKELYIYVYQPAHNSIDLLGTKVSISYGYSVDGAGLEPQVYDLELASTSGVFDKYHVKGFTPSKDGDRYYNIVSIYREYNSVIDSSDETFPTTDIAYSVGQQWYVCDLNGSRHYEMNTFNTMHVDTVFSGNLIFEDGIKWGEFLGMDEMCDSWLYCFNAEDYQIKYIFDADLNYSIRHVKEYRSNASGQSSYTYSDERPNQVITLYDSDVMTYNGGGLFSRTFEWNRIMSSKDFLQRVDELNAPITQEQRTKIESSQWVFSYLETARTDTDYSSGDAYSYEDVYDVGLLRLHFQDFSGAYYDLGVVNSLTDPDNIADGIGHADIITAFEDFWENFILVVGLIIGLILLLVLFNFIAPISTLLNYLIKAIAYVISLPFRLIKWVFKKDGR